MKVAKNILLLILIQNFLYANDANKDSDMDGVPNSSDVCTHTPFLDVVDKRGCSTERLVLPEDKESNSLDIIFGLGQAQNEDELNREKQHISTFQAYYYNNDWIYSLKTGYFTQPAESNMEDTTLSIRKRFQVSKKLKLTTGVGLKLPTYDFEGNKADYLLTGAFNYYPTNKVSLYFGGSYDFLQDEEVFTPLQNVHTLYVGTGYFLNKTLYGHVSYSNSNSKFVEEHNIQIVSATLFYQINPKWFTSLSYHHEIADEDLHNNINIKLGYSVW